MNRPFLVALLSGALLPLAAHAQTAPKYTVQFGVNQPTNRSVRQSTQNTGYAVGVGYGLPRANFSGQASVDALIGRNKGNGNALDTLGIYLAERIYAPGGGRKTYYGAALGYTRATLKVAAAQEGSTPVSASKSGEGVGFRVLAGTELTRGLVLEAAYTTNPPVTIAGTRYQTNAVTITLGKSF